MMVGPNDAPPVEFQGPAQGFLCHSYQQQVSITAIDVCDVQGL